MEGPLPADPYECPRCGANLPNEHKIVPDSSGDPDGWQCPDGKIIWVWLGWPGTAWRYGRRWQRDD